MRRFLKSAAFAASRAGLLALLALVPATARADHAISVGGCDPKGGENDRETRFVADAFDKLSWRKSDRLFGDDFTADKFKKLLDPAKFVDGEKVFINIRTHGQQGPPHGICMSNPITHENTWVDVSDFQPLLKKLADEKHVKIAFADGSCYGAGSIRELASPDVCVVSSTSDNTMSFNSSVGSSIAARVLATRDPAAAKTLLAKYPGMELSLGALTQPSAELDGVPGMSLEEAFLTARSFRGYASNPNNHRAAQISSDVEGAGLGMRDVMAGGYDFLSTDFNLTASPDSAVIRRAFGPDYFAAGKGCDLNNPFPDIDRLSKSLKNVGFKQRAEDTAKRLGFDSIQDAFQHMKDYYGKRHQNYLKWTGSAAEIQELNQSLAQAPDASPLRTWISLKKRADAIPTLLEVCRQVISMKKCDPSLPEPLPTRAEQLKNLEEEQKELRTRMSSLQKKIDDVPGLDEKQARYQKLDETYRKAFEEDKNSVDSAEFMRMEKVFYEVKYLEQRQRTAEAKNAKACSGFVF